MEISVENAMELGTIVGIDWASVKFTPTEFRRGLLVEIDGEDLSMEPGSQLFMAGKLVWERLKAIPDFYDLRAIVERGEKRR